jgi:uncharacterized membrane protein YeaQ/YmgE (transglycosylase-associated protein family)
VIAAVPFSCLAGPLCIFPENPFFQTYQEAIMLSLLWEAIIGLIVGALAKFLMPGKDPGGIFITMLIGVAGSLLATFIGSHVGLYQEGQRAGFIMSLLGAVVLLAIYRVIKGRMATK